MSTARATLARVPRRVPCEYGVSTPSSTHVPSYVGGIGTPASSRNVGARSRFIAIAADVLIIAVRVRIDRNKGTDNRSKGTENRNMGTGNRSKGTDNRAKGSARSMFVSIAADKRRRRGGRRSGGRAGGYRSTGVQKGWHKGKGGRERWERGRVRMGGEGARVGSDARPSDHERDADVGLERPHLFHRQPHLRRATSGTSGSALGTLGVLHGVL